MRGAARHGGWRALLAGVCLLALASWPRSSRDGLPSENVAGSVLLQRTDFPAAADLAARDLMEADIAAYRQKTRAAEDAADDVWSPSSPAILGPRVTQHVTRANRRRAKDQQRAALRRARRAEEISPAAKEEYLQNAPENISWSPYHVVPAQRDSKAHRGGKFGISKVAQGQNLWIPKVAQGQNLWMPEVRVRVSVCLYVSMSVCFGLSLYLFLRVYSYTSIHIYMYV